MTPNNHPPFDFESAAEMIRSTWSGKGPCLVPKKESLTLNSTNISSHENDYCRCDILHSMEWQHSQDLRTMIPREKVEKLVSTVEHSLDFLEGYSHSPGVTLCLEHLRMRIEEFNHPDGKDENGGT